MTAPPINLTRIRDRVEREVAIGGRQPYSLACTPPVLLALLETVEAAQAVLDDPATYASEQIVRLEAALAKFTWTQP